MVYHIFYHTCDRCCSLADNANIRFVQVIPLHPPPGDMSNERTVQIEGTSEQIEAAKQMVNEVIEVCIAILYFMGSVFILVIHYCVLEVWRIIIIMSFGFRYVCALLLSLRSVFSFLWARDVDC